MKLQEYKWIRIDFEKKTKSGKTMIFYVRNKKYSDFLGWIKWNTGYRKYAFYPEENTYYEEDCLKNLSEFLDKLNKECKKCKK